LPNSRPVVCEGLFSIAFTALKNRPRIVLCASLLLVSCGAKSAPALINCTAVGNSSSAHVHLTPCSPQASNGVQLDNNGSGATSACPSDDNVEIVLTRNGQTTYILPDQVHVGRAGDGIAVAIDADLK
jgi:hypothetical protein